jgi:hypothetical protein
MIADKEVTAECYTDDNGTEAKLIRTRVSNERLKTGKASRVWHGRWNWNPRQTKQRMAGRRQGLVPDGRARSKQSGTIKIRMEEVCRTCG